MKTSAFNQKGLFGGLMHELRLNATDLISHINKTWNVDCVTHALDVEDWHRGGNETYVCRGQLITADDSVVEVIGKAFVGSGLLPENQQARWENRRNLLTEHKVTTPKLFAKYPAMSIEEFIDNPLPDARSITPELAFQIGLIASTLEELNFFPISMLTDLRVKDGIVYYVDFGSDLGSQDQLPQRNWLNEIRKKIGIDSVDSFDHGLYSRKIKPS